MIVFPHNWQSLGHQVTLGDIDKALREAIREIDCANLSLSGGVDSSLLLYYLLEAGRSVHTYTIANSPDHPDIVYARLAVRYYEERFDTHISCSVLTRPMREGDDLVYTFYKVLADWGVESIIAGDCIDELACGYYAHQDLREQTYHEYLNQLHEMHLAPLHKNSGNVHVYLPYASDRVATLFHQIPLYEKVDHTGRKLPIINLAIPRVPWEIIERKKYGFGTTVSKVAA